jgi:3-oxoacyl-[acyl-carrier-protein] synthase II
LGAGCDSFWQALTSGRSNIKPVSRFSTEWFSVHIAAEIDATSALPLLTPDESAALKPAAAYSLSAARQALAQGGWLDEQGHARCPDAELYFGTNKGDFLSLEQEAHAVFHLDPATVKRAITRELLTDNPCYGLLPTVASRLNLTGMQSLISNACSTGGYCLAWGADRIRQGHTKLAICGGVDILSEAVYAGFCSLRSLAPEKCQPFDRNRQGLLLGEAAAVMVLESTESCAQRGIAPLAILQGWGWSCDAHHLSAPHPEGRGTHLAMQRALQHAQLTPNDIDCIVAHGTGTTGNDRMEAHVFHQLFGETPPPVTAPKSMLGHSISAASAVEAIVAAMATHTDTIPPTINFTTADPECSIDCVPNATRLKLIHHCQTNASSFGGNNVSLIFSKPSSGRVG